MIFFLISVASVSCSMDTCNALSWIVHTATPWVLICFQRIINDCPCSRIVGIDVICNA